jgi:hypothetical protein
MANPEFISLSSPQELIYIGHMTPPVGGLICLPLEPYSLMQLLADYEQQRQHLMRKHGIDLEDNPQGDGSRTKRLDRKDFEALMGGDGRSGIFTWREKNRRKVRMIVVLVLAKSSHRRSMHLSAGLLSVSYVQ